MNWRLRTLIGEYEDKNPGERLTYRRLEEEINVSKVILNKIGKNEQKRADLDTIQKILDYFTEKLGRRLTTEDLLEYNSKLKPR